MLDDLRPATKYYYKIVSGNSSVTECTRPRIAGDKTHLSTNAIIDLGVYGEDGYTIRDDNRKRETFLTCRHRSITPLLCVLLMADDYELIIHTGDLGYADTSLECPKNRFQGKDAFQAILEQFYDQ